ncbi:MAG: diguanylate cyclase [Armatimonadota bacterium]|nr:diguanylate cyclase [Armatimonadota bacterium]MDR5697369.1 diguanylate cyclase [Armatimonadota bacterium]
MGASKRWRDKLAEVVRRIREALAFPEAAAWGSTGGEQTWHALLITHDPQPRRWVPTYTEPGWATSVAPDAAEAMELLRVEHYDLILLDLRTPSADPIELVQDIHAYRQVPIVVAGVRADRQVIGNALAAGADDFFYIDDTPQTSSFVLRHTMDRARLTGTLREGYTAAARDFLTGADSEQAFSAAYAAAMARSPHTGEDLSVIRLGVENLATINAAFGRHVGDLVLREVARMLRAQVRRTDHIGRLRGGQFAVLLPGAGSTRAEEVVTRLRAATAQLRLPEQPDLYLRLRIGWAVRGDVDTDPLAVAEHRMSAADPIVAGPPGAY